MNDSSSHRHESRGRREKVFAQRFGRLLREELEAGGHPTYQAIANRGGISKSAVSDAMRGVRLPSARTVWSIMIGMGRPAEAIVAERDRLVRELTQGARDSPKVLPAAMAEAGDVLEPASAEQQGTVPHDSPVLESPMPVSPSFPAESPAAAERDVGTRNSRSRRFLWVLVGTFVVGLVIGALSSWLVLASATPTTAKPLAPETGTGVVDSGCMRDGVKIADAGRAFETRLELWLSYECRAVWGVVRRGAEQEHGSLEVAVYPQVDPEASWSQRHSVDGAATAFTNIIVIPEHRLKSVCVMATVGQAGQTLEETKPLCVSLG